MARWDPSVARWDERVELIEVAPWRYTRCGLCGWNQSIGESGRGYEAHPTCHKGSYELTPADLPVGVPFGEFLIAHNRLPSSARPYSSWSDRCRSESVTTSYVLALSSEAS